jgi:hypothetical protein
MVAFVQGRAVTTRVATVVVDPGLPVGAHRFQLVAVDAAGLRSRPDVAVVRIAAGVPGPSQPTGRPRLTKRSHR